MTAKPTKKTSKSSKSSVPFSSPLTSAHYDKDDITGGSNPKDKKKKKKETKNEENKESRNYKRREAKRLKRRKLEKEEERLTSMIFGGNDDDAMEDSDKDDFLSNLSSAKNDTETSHEDMGKSDDGNLFEIDRSGLVDDDNVESNDYVDADEISESKEGGSLSSTSENNNIVNGAVWNDEGGKDLNISLATKSNTVKKLRKTMSDDNVNAQDYEDRLRERFQSTVGAMAHTEWANVENLNKQSGSSDEESSTSDDDEDYPTATKLLSSSAPLLSSKSSQIPSNIIKLIRRPDANLSDPSQSTVQSVQFHPASDEDAPLLLTAGLDKTLRFFRVNEEANEKIHGVIFPKLPIHKASFLGDTGSVVVTGRRPFFYIYNAEAGKIDLIPKIHGREDKSLENFTTSPDGSLIAFIGNDGFIILLETKTKMWVANLKINGSVRALAFTPDGDFLLASGSDSEVYRWDIRSKRCVDRFRNEDGTITSALSVSSRFLAVGAESGVVNIYDGGRSNSGYETMRKPIKSIMNLQTSIDLMKFNHDGQILAMSSHREKNSLKLLHVPTQTIFANWPTSKTPLHYVSSLDFSPSSKFMAIGNDKGKCLLYKLGHYED
eukprot:CAMPEP_0197831150 /NCGR_PEP_ID=MMETSP1437-20131217/7734_1 /TAXON_ID=49252 ORGANISM="Eucampia antarctica, Strain CCMP1452" /NCGR_SAMPLE_ID=MMETSP1437 /ASSEMBLY_ACC=CAM_ASM_001096 /LENGTH=605 /DNA_ID=CAMNT_0043433937 /DNA_START=195 /DNA_END=2012 /DNA_ORIENTATION=-